MPITLDRSVCCDLNETISREWLVTNGLGGYAAGTVASVLTRMQHGLLVASPPEAGTPQLLLAKIDEEVVFDQRTYYLGTNEYRDGTLNPSGFVHLETFRLEEGFPIFTYHLGGINGIMLEKRIWMPQGHNTTYIQYRVLRTASPDDYQRGGTTGALNNGYGRYYEYTETAQHALTLTLLPFAAHRPHNQPQYGNNDWHFQVQRHRISEQADEDDVGQTVSLPKGVVGCTIRAWKGAHPYHILAVGHPESQATFIPTGVWYWNFLRRHDAATGQPATDDLYLPGVIRTTLWSGEDATLTIIVSAEELSSLSLRSNQLNLSYKRSVEAQQQLLGSVIQPQRYFGEGGEAAQANRLNVLPFTTTPDPREGGEDYLRHLVQAGNRFLTRQKLHDNGYVGDHDILFSKQERTTILLSDYYSMESRTRDALIALPGLTLVTGRYDEALRILRQLARHFKQGLLPDHLPLPGRPLEDPGTSSSVDTTLWYFYALDSYLQVSRNYELLDELYGQLVESINCYVQGTYNGIQVDARDGLLRAHQPGKALTWMNASVDDIPITPRAGKPVEVNALWYHALSLMHEWSLSLHRAGRTVQTPSFYQELLAQCKHSFQQRFWYAAGDHLYDVVDGPDGDDAALRPNQLLALSLRYSVLDELYQQPVFDGITKHLLTPYGLRTLAPQETVYQGRLGGHRDAQQRALHQGSVWSWLIGPYINSLLSIGYSPTVPQDEHLCQEYLWRKGLQLLVPFQERFDKGLLGMCEGVFDGERPHSAGWYTASAMSIGELLRVYNILAQMPVAQPAHALSRS